MRNGSRLYRLEWHQLGKCCGDDTPTPHKPSGAMQCVSSERFARREASLTAKREGMHVYAYDTFGALQFLAYAEGGIYDAISKETE